MFFHHKLKGKKTLKKDQKVHIYVYTHTYIYICTYKYIF